MKLITSDKLRKEIGKAARKRIIENFNIEDQTKKLIEIYSSLIPANK